MKLTKQQKQFKNKNLKCKRCGSINSRFRSETKDYLCRKCGNIWENKK